MWNILIPAVTIGGAILIHFLTKNKSFLFVNFVFIVLGSILVVAGGASVLYSMYLANTDMVAAWKHFAQLYPDVRAVDLLNVLRTMENCAFIRGFGIGMSTASALLLFTSRKLMKSFISGVQSRIQEVKARVL